MDRVHELEKQANKHIAEKDLGRAKLAFEQAIGAMQDSPTRDLVVLGRLLNNVGFVCRESGDFEGAERYFQQALDAYRQLGTPDNPELAITLQHLGRMAHRKHDYEASWSLWTEAFSIWKRLVLEKEQAGYIHYLASCLHALAEHLADTGKYSQARQNFEQALDFREKVLPPDHPDTAENLANLGRLCAYMEDFAAARAYLTRAVLIYKNQLSAQHPIVLELETLLAQVENQVGKAN